MNLNPVLKRPIAVIYLTVAIIWIASAFGTFYFDLEGGPNKCQIAVQTGEFLVTLKKPNLGVLLPLDFSLGVFPQHSPLNELVFQWPHFHRPNGDIQFWFPLWLVVVIIYSACVLTRRLSTQAKNSIARGDDP